LPNSAALRIGNKRSREFKLIQQYEGGILSPQDLQARYAAALSRIGGGTTKESAKKHTPIFKRQPAMTQTESIQDAANALAAIWKVAKS
jgi:hypothetical protein